MKNIFWFSTFQNEFTFVLPKEFKLTLYSLCNLYFYLNHISNDKFWLKCFIKRNTTWNEEGLKVWYSGKTTVISCWTRARLWFDNDLQHAFTTIENFQGIYLLELKCYFWAGRNSANQIVKFGPELRVWNNRKRIRNSTVEYKLYSSLCNLVYYDCCW